MKIGPYGFKDEELLTELENSAHLFSGLHEKVQTEGRTWILLMHGINRNIYRSGDLVLKCPRTDEAQMEYDFRQSGIKGFSRFVETYENAVEFQVFQQAHHYGIADMFATSHALLSDGQVLLVEFVRGRHSRFKHDAAPRYSRVLSEANLEPVDLHNYNIKGGRIVDSGEFGVCNKPIWDDYHLSHMHK